MMLQKIFKLLQFNDYILGSAERYKALEGGGEAALKEAFIDFATRIVLFSWSEGIRLENHISSAYRRASIQILYSTISCESVEGRRSGKRSKWRHELSGLKECINSWELTASGAQDARRVEPAGTNGADWTADRTLAAFDWSRANWFWTRITREAGRGRTAGWFRAEGRSRTAVRGRAADILRRHFTAVGLNFVATRWRFAALNFALVAGHFEMESNWFHLKFGELIGIRTELVETLRKMNLKSSLWVWLMTEMDFLFWDFAATDDLKPTSTF